MTKLLWTLLLGLALAVAPACGDDDDGGDEDAGAEADGGDMDSGTVDEDSGTVDEDAGTVDEDAGTVDEDAGTGTDAGGEASAEAMAFCSEYETECGYDDTDDAAYDDEATCLAYYDAASAGCVTCIEEHLDNVVSMGTAHCPHTYGMGPCNGACP